MTNRNTIDYFLICFCIYVFCMEISIILECMRGEQYYIISAAWQCNGVTVYDRDEWGARDPACLSPMSTPVVYTFIHHTVTAECSDFSSCSQKARDVQNFHMDGNGNRQHFPFFSFLWKSLLENISDIFPTQPCYHAGTPIRLITV